MSVADISRALSIEQQPLSGRIERLLADLRRQLLAAGVTADEWGRLAREGQA